MTTAETTWLEKARPDERRLFTALTVLNGLTLDDTWGPHGIVELRFKPSVFTPWSRDRAVFDLVAYTLMSCKNDLRALPLAPTRRLRPARALIVEGCVYLSRGMATIRDKVIASSSDGEIPWKVRRRAAGWISTGADGIEQAGAALSAWPALTTR